MITAIMAVVMLFMSSKAQNSVKLAALVKKNTDAILAVESVQAQIIFDYVTTPFGIVGPRTDFQGLTVSNEFTADFKGTTKQLDHFSVEVQDLLGLISIMPFNKKEFYKLLDKEGVSIEQMNTIDDRLQDWQDEDNLVRIEGAERGDFTEPFLPTNMAFQSKKELGYIINDKALLDRISPFLAFYSSDYIVRQYMPNSLYSFLDLPVPEDQGMEAIDTYPSGRYQIIISYDKDLSITKKFTLLRGVSTFRPFFITNDELVFQ